jgi:hypothetical protein
MFALARVQGALDRQEQDIDEHVMESQELVGNKAHQMEMAIILGPT